MFYLILIICNIQILLGLYQYYYKIYNDKDLEYNKTINIIYIILNVLLIIFLYIKLRPYLLKLFMSNIKNKSKYKQKGGNIITEDISNDEFNNRYIRVSNNFGQNNCGIFLDKEDNTKILKCYQKQPNIDNIQDANTLLQQKKIQIFPIIHKLIQSNNKFYIYMDKFDGDLTQLCLNVLVNILVDTDEFKLYKDDILMIINLKINIINIYDTETILHLISKLNFINNITKEIFENFIKQLFIQWNKLLADNISMQIIRQYLILRSIGYYYSDMKFDNFAYKLSDMPLNNHLPLDNIDDFSFKLNDKTVDIKVFKSIDNDNIFYSEFLQKYLYIYIIDWDSGLFKYNGTYSNIKYYKQIEDNFKNMGILGQYKMVNLFNTHVIFKQKNLINSEIYLKLSDNIKVILSQDYSHLI